MAIDLACKVINGEDSAISDVFSATAATAIARDVTSVSAASAEVVAFATLASAVAVVPKTITATQLKRLAWTALLEAGVSFNFGLNALNGGANSVDTPSELADSNAVANLKLGLRENRQFANALADSLV